MPPQFQSTDALSLVAYAGDAKTLLAWDIPETGLKNLAGFTIACRPPGVDEYYLRNRLQFEDPGKHVQDPKEPANSSINAPLHKFRWLHVPGSVHQGLKPVWGQYTYTVTPRYFNDEGSLQALDANLSASVPIVVNPFEKGSLQLGFTRGYVQSQAYVEHFGAKSVIAAPADSDLLWDTSAIAGENSRGEKFSYAQEYEWLGFTARERIHALLDEVLEAPELRLDMFAYDLNEPDVMKKLIELAEQGRVRVILDNADLHHNAKKPEAEDNFEAEFSKRANAKADAQANLPAAIQRGHFGRYAHDKILLISEGNEAKKALTGSTNFSVTGMYVNSNHVLVFSDKETTAKYGELFDQVWQEKVELKPFAESALAKEPFSPAGATPPHKITFSPHSKDVAEGVLDTLVARVKQEGTNGTATGSVLFAVMGLTGSGEVYPTLRALHENEKIFSYGVSDEANGVALYAPGKATGVLVTGKPGATQLPPPFSQVPSVGKGHQIHHKFVICGFNGEDPVVFCGSSNLALGGEEENGDNLLEIRDGDVATAFALEAIALVDHFQFLDKLSAAGAKDKTPPASKTLAAKAAGWFLSTSDGWSKPYFDANDLHCVDRLLFAAPAAKAA